MIHFSSNNLRFITNKNIQSYEYHNSGYFYLFTYTPRLSYLSLYQLRSSCVHVLNLLFLYYNVLVSCSFSFSSKNCTLLSSIQYSANLDCLCLCPHPESILINPFSSSLVIVPKSGV